LQEEVGSPFAIRVRGTGPSTGITFAERAPHPDPLPVKDGEREKIGYHFLIDPL
jgi:hypothetical protein